MVGNTVRSAVPCHILWFRNFLCTGAVVLCHSNCNYDDGELRWILVDVSLTIFLETATATTSRIVVCTVVGLSTPASAAAATSGVSISTFDSDGVGVDFAANVVMPAIVSAAATSCALVLSSYVKATSATITVMFTGSSSASAVGPTCHGRR